MKLTTKALYTVSALIDLALHQAKGAVALRDISSRQTISLAYLEQLFNKLRKADIVKSSRGPSGGYQLAKPAEQITIAAILCAIDEITENACCGFKQNCMLEQCLAHDLWRELDNHTQQFLQQKNLAMLLEKVEVPA